MPLPCRAPAGLISFAQLCLHPVRDLPAFHHCDGDACVTPVRKTPSRSLYSCANGAVAAARDVRIQRSCALANMFAHGGFLVWKE